jgi:hypothetical protein
MSAEPQQRQRAVRQERTDEAFAIEEPIHNPRIGPRVIPIIVTAIIGIVIIALLFFAPWG